MAGGWSDEAREKRFWAKVDRTDTCWLWTGTLDRKGYGRRDWHGKKLFAHRLAWMLTRGPIPPGLVIDHICRVHNCVNPDHLRLLTSVENVMIGVSPPAIFARKTHCIAGHPFNEENTHFNAKGQRWCKPCWRRRRREARAREAANRV